MNTIYVDFTGDSLGSKKVKYHGGGDFSRFILWKLNEKLKNKTNLKICVLWPQGVDISRLSEEEQRIHNTFESRSVNNLASVDYHNGDILFLPLLDAFSVRKIGGVKKHNSQVKLYGVLHGIRLLDVCKYDKYDKFYYNGIKSLSIVLWVRRWMAGALSVLYLKQNLKLADKIYTVSNCSMQKINSIAKIKNIKYFTRDITPVDDLQTENKSIEDKFILFINANRYEKNFIRSLEAFCRFKEMKGGDLNLYVLGASEQLQENICKIKSINKNIVGEYVKFLGYVTPQRLRQFFSNCEFLLYTSKSEGYGLPPLEAMTAGRPTLASSTTSVPEVLGMCAHYVNPYSVEDIARGIEYMADPKNQTKYTRLFPVYLPLIQQRGEADINMLVTELLS